MKRGLFTDICAICIILVLAMFFPSTVFAEDKPDGPTISNAAASNFTKTGFDVSCISKGKNGVEKVLFPVWTEKDGQDDIIWYESQYLNGRWNCHINYSDHKGSMDKYIIHIYSYDKMGNVSAQVMNPVIPGDNLGYLSNNLPDVRFTPVDFMQFYGKDPSEFRGMPGFEEWVSSPESGEFRYYPESPLWWVIEIKYDYNRIYHIGLSFYSKDISYGSNFRVWGMYSGMRGEEALSLLSQHGYDCFYVQPSYWQWKDDGRYTVDVMWDADGTLDSITINPSRR